MRSLLFTIVLLFAGLSFGGGSEVPWPAGSEEPVFLEDIAGYWTSDGNEDQVETYYHFYFQKMGTRPGCPYIVGVDEVDASTQVITNRGMSSYCIVHPRKLSFVMYNANGIQSHVLNFVGVKKESNSSAVLGMQYIGFSLYGDSIRIQPLQQALLHKFTPILK
jgi:hypothetical protein